jgi:hypothetical protein
MVNDLASCFSFLKNVRLGEYTAGPGDSFPNNSISYSLKYICLDFLKL